MNKIFLLKVNIESTLDNKRVECEIFVQPNNELNAIFYNIRYLPEDKNYFGTFTEDYQEILSAFTATHEQRIQIFYYSFLCKKINHNRLFGKDKKINILAPNSDDIDHINRLAIMYGKPNTKLIIKAVNFIELFNASKEDIKNTCDHIGIKNDIYNLRSYLNQPFEVELLTQIFTGWDDPIPRYWGQSTPCQYNFIHSDTQARINFNISSGIVEYLNESNLIHTVIPKSLDEFITDCNRCGINLFYKKL